MPGAPDPEYVAARRVLLDALEALDDHRAVLILVGAQAIYMHTGEGDLAVAPYTTDGDIALDPAELGPAPKLEDAMRHAGFRLDEQQPGVWFGTGSLERAGRSPLRDRRRWSRRAARRQAPQAR